jgi:hypothetical protein
MRMRGLSSLPERPGRQDREVLDGFRRVSHWQTRSQNLRALCGLRPYRLSFGREGFY